MAQHKPNQCNPGAEFSFLNSPAYSSQILSPLQALSFVSRAYGSMARAFWSVLVNILLSLMLLFGVNIHRAVAEGEGGQTQPGQKPLVVTTIKPLTMIAHAVLGDLVEIRQLLPDTEVPHHFSLRMSDRRLLDRADLIVWVGPGMETFLVNILDSQKDGSVLTAAELNSVFWPEGTGQGRDYHLWLNPDNALALAQSLVESMADLKGSDRALLATNLHRFEQEITELKSRISERLLTVKGAIFIADHDAFSHFTTAFGLRSAGFLRDGSGLEIGVREMAQLMAKEGVSCLIAEPESRLDRMQKIAETLGSKLEVIDPLGADITLLVEDSNTAYGRFLASIADGFYRCLNGSGSD